MLQNHFLLNTYGIDNGNSMTFVEQFCKKFGMFYFLIRLQRLIAIFEFFDKSIDKITQGFSLYKILIKLCYK